MSEGVSSPLQRELALPPSAARAVWLIGRLAARRFINRGLTRWRKAAPAGKRAGTARKGLAGRLLIAFLSMVLAFNSVNLSTTIVRNAAARAERLHVSGETLIDDGTMEWVNWADQARGTTASDEDAKESRESLRSAFTDCARRQGYRTDEARDRQVESLLRTFDEKGAAGFRRSTVPFRIFPDRDLWKHNVEELEMLLPLGVVATLFALGVALTSAFGANSEIARVESTLEWWFTFPVSPRALLLARVLETAFVNGPAWFLLFPFFTVVYVCAGKGAWAPCVAAGVTVYVGLLAGSMRVLAETSLRRFVPLRVVAGIQAVLAVLASVLFVAALASVSPPAFDLQADFAARLPEGLLLSPFALPLGLLSRAALGTRAMLLLPVFGLGSVLLAVVSGAFLLRDGLVSSFSENQGTRRDSFEAVPALSAFGAVARKEFLSVVRNRTRLGQTLIAPMILGGVQLLMNPTLLSDLRHAPRIAAAVAYMIAALSLSGGATGALIVEVSALWLLLTIPKSLEEVLFAKATLWAFVSTVLAVVVFVGLVAMSPDFELAHAAYFLLVPIGLVIQAFVAVALGALGTDPFATDARRQLRPAMMYLFLLVAGMFGYVLYTPSAWAKFTEIVLTTLLAFALWQKVRDHAPFLLDPTEAPPPQIAVADGIIAALSFFVLQGLLLAVMLRNGISPGKGLLYAFALAGFVVAFFALLVLRQSGLHDLTELLGLWVPGTRPIRAVGLGFCAGLVAFAIAAGYTALIRHFGWLAHLRNETFGLSPRDRDPEMLRFLGVLSVFAAPPVEELIFRGLLYRGLRRSMSTFRAVVGSALVFALVHPPIAFFPVLVLAILAATIYERSKLLLAPIAAHATYNALLFAFALQ
jgi:membrane protease YdiL (CAAX protease family)